MLDAPNKFQEMLLETPEFGQQEDAGAPVPASYTKHQPLGRSRSCGSAGDKLSYAAFVEINPKITVSAT